MFYVDFDKKEVVGLIKRYFETFCQGQSIKVRVMPKRISTVSEADSKNKLVTNCNISILNSFLVDGYLEENGMLHKFSKRLSDGDLKEIFTSFLDEENDVEDMEMINNLRFSLDEEDRLMPSFVGCKVGFKMIPNKCLGKR